MEYWFQRILLKPCLLALAVSTVDVLAEETTTQINASNVNTEYFDMGVFTGFINIEDFTSEAIVGINGTFNANEDYFMQINYLQTDVSLSSYEQSQGQLFSGSDRTFTHFDFLVGYNVFQGEHFMKSTKENLSSLYVVAGIGDTEFGGESGFTYTIGAGYQVALSRKWLVRLDYRDHIYKTNIIGEDKSTHNNQMSLGISYQF
ncbi:outer membrane beta-barrel domain-containing protein [Pleionea sp. CnH1-48]|uniref:outer membrane beta-barrel domain-containing protein n=1 Tax=Pleionea sp. CnH1-48 TaxID=2954494 RepID=UPI0020985B22|nr:outer membrane beta-barrel domain-containing protein [Pleionea sp. CnH1-48]MCO7223241.1 outer membrane beta-barrel domain-containing protein [Pleionea sp. CnH1-48]